MFLQRAVVTLTMGPLGLYLIYRGGWFYFLPVTAVMTLATIEYSDIMHHMGWRTSRYLLVPTIIVLMSIAQWYSADLLNFAIFIALLLALGYALWLYEYNLSTSVPADWLAMTGGVVLLGWLGSHFLRIRGLEQMAWQWTMLAMLSTWITDSAAYVVGRFLAGTVLGRHRLSPRLSPNKTVEGYMAGIILGTLLTGLFASLLNLSASVGIILGLVISIFSVLGDLAMSLIKREAGIKDSGRLFPGHGGALDRIDSLIWSVTLAYYVAVFFS